MDVNLRALGRLVWRRDAGELGDHTGTSLLVQALGITLLGDLDGDVDVDLDEREGFVVGAGVGGSVQVAGGLAVGFVGGDEGGYGDGGGVCEEFGDLCKS